MERGQRRTPPQSRTGQPQRRPQSSTQRPAQRPPQNRPQGSQQRRPAQSARPMPPTRPVSGKRRKNTPKKPWIIGAIVVLLLILILGSGGDNADVTANNAATQNPTSAPVSDTVVTVTEAPTQAPTETPSLYPQTIFDQNGLTITLTGFDKNTLMGPEIKFTVENNSGESLIVQTGSLHCNGWQIVDATSFIEVANGAKVAEVMIVWSTYLDNCQLKASDLVNVEFKGASITTSDYMKSYEFDMTATLQ